MADKTATDPMAAPENPPAFPGQTDCNEWDGMTLRDWFAGTANDDAIAEAWRAIVARGETPTEAAARYDYADAMLTERQRRKS